MLLLANNFVKVVRLLYLLYIQLDLLYYSYCVQRQFRKVSFCVFFKLAVMVVFSTSYIVSEEPWSRFSE